MLGWKKSFNQPAKLAERVLAPGDGEAEPGVTAGNFKEPAKLATDGFAGSLLIDHHAYGCFDRIKYKMPRAVCGRLRKHP